MEVQELLKNEAIKLGLCQQWQDEWGVPDTDALCDKFIRGIDFCIKHDFPKVELINKLFNQEELHKNGIYTTGDCESYEQKDVITMGDSVVNVTVPAYRLCDIYVRHDSRINLIVGAHSFVYFTLLDNGTVNIVRKNESAKIMASYYSGSIENKELVDTIHYK